jgi:ABC-type multidrug transport system permease subunit
MRTLEFAAAFIVAVLYVIILAITGVMILVGKGGEWIREQSLKIW